MDCAFLTHTHTSHNFRLCNFSIHDTLNTGYVRTHLSIGDIACCILHTVITHAITY